MAALILDSLFKLGGCKQGGSSVLMIDPHKNFMKNKWEKIHFSNQINNFNLFYEIIALNQGLS